MANRNAVESMMVEFNRFGRTERAVDPDSPYIRTAGFDRPAISVALSLDHYGYLGNIGKLRYETTRAEAQKALKVLSDEAAKMLPELPPSDDSKTVQIDLVTGAAELWAFPFEARCLDDGTPLLADPRRRVVLTRRIRGEFAEHRDPWPATPRVLYAHAPIENDLTRSLVDEHAEALVDALRPWTAGDDPGKDLLEVREIGGAADLADANEFTHIHLLAHGSNIVEPEPPHRVESGLRLGRRGSTPVSAAELASAIRPKKGLPIVITLAACDSANRGDPVLPGRSIAQELHLNGVPVVIGSQFPLTKRGSVVLTRTLYAALFRSDDVRDALYATRRALYASAEAGHDWLSLVSYVRLPEGYAEHLVDTGLRAELVKIKAVQRKADAVLARPTAEGLATVERLMRARIAALEGQLENLGSAAGGLREECQGLLASAHKRLAEILFVGGPHLGGDPEAARTAARVALETSLSYYRAAFKSDVNKHWQGVQQLALEAVLRGRISTPVDWAVATYIAQRAADADPNDYWARGSLAELYLLQTLAGQPDEPELAEKAVAEFHACASNQPDAIESTTRQLRRYVTWWTSENGFFAGSDLRGRADRLLELLVQKCATGETP